MCYSVSGYFRVITASWKGVASNGVQNGIPDSSMGLPYCSDSSIYICFKLLQHVPVLSNGVSIPLMLQLNHLPAFPALPLPVAEIYLEAIRFFRITSLLHTIPIFCLWSSFILAQSFENRLPPILMEVRNIAFSFFNHIVKHIAEPIVCQGPTFHFHDYLEEKPFVPWLFH